MKNFMSKLAKGIGLGLFGLLCCFFGMSIQLAGSKAHEDGMEPSDMPRGPLGWLCQISMYAKKHFDQAMEELGW